VNGDGSSSTVGRPVEPCGPLRPGQATATAAGVLGFVTVGLTTVFSLVLLAGVLELRATSSSGWRSSSGSPGC
jgi:hypothetical protein